MTNIKEVARVAGVGVGTVSRVMSGRGNVSAATREKVEKAARQVGYRPNDIARALRSNRSNMVGLIVPDLVNEFYRYSSSVIQSVLEEKGYGLLLGVSNNQAKIEERAINRLVSQQVDGIIYVPSADSSASEFGSARRPLSVVELHRHSSGSQFDAILCDEFEGGKWLTEHLLKLGHRRLTLIVGQPHFSTTRDRVGGVQAAIDEHEGGDKVELKILHGSYTSEWGQEALGGQLSRGERPTAVIAGSSLITLGCLKAISDASLSCPDDISLVSCGHSDWLHVTCPHVTAFSLPLEEMGRLAAETLLDRISRSSAVQSAVQPVAIRISGRLEMGTSTAAPFTSR